MFRQELDNEGDVTEVTLVLDAGTHPEIEIEPDELDAADATRSTPRQSATSCCGTCSSGGFVEPA